MAEILIMVPHHWPPLGYLSPFTTNQADGNPGITEEAIVSALVLRSTIIATSELLTPKPKQCSSRTQSIFVISTSLNLFSRQLISSFMRSTHLQLKCTTCQNSTVSSSSKQSTTCVAYSKPVDIPRPPLLPSLKTHLSISLPVHQNPMHQNSKIHRQLFVSLDPEK